MSECKFRAADGECLREKMFPYKEYCVDAPCPHYTAQTNADRIRAMTDEELANFLDCVEMGDIDYSKTFCDLCDGFYDCHDDCLLGWLRAEATI